MGRYKNRYSRFAPYVCVAERKTQAASIVKKLKKKGQAIQPIILEGKMIAHTFWGKAWCNHLEKYSDYENRLPRGRSCVRSHSVIDLQISDGKINALVNGSALYKITVSITALPKTKWVNIANECAGKIDSLVELLQGKFSKGVMEIMTHQKTGLFPDPKEIKFKCSCPDWADMCKHVAAVLYGIGARIDENPEILFLLRQVDHNELISQASKTSFAKGSAVQSDVLADSDLSALFGIDIEQPNANKNKTRKKKITTQ